MVVPGHELMHYLDFLCTTYVYTYEKPICAEAKRHLFRQKSPGTEEICVMCW